MSVEKSAAWHCIDCNPIGMVPVVADYESLKSALQAFGAEPPEAIQKPQQYKFPTKVPNPGRSWICGCQLVFARGLAEEVSVLVYLDQRKYLMETGYVKNLDEFEPERNEESEKEWEGSEELSSVDPILRLHAGELDSSYTEQSNQSYNDFYAENRILENELGESRDYGDTLMLAKNDHVRDDVSVNSNFTSVSQLADLHGFMSDQDGELIIVENDHDSFTDDGSMTAWDRELARLAKHHGVDLSKDLNTVTEIQSEIESHLTNVLVNLEGSMSRPARKKQSAQDAEDKDLQRLLANIMQHVEMVQEPSPAPIVPDQAVEIVEVSDEEEDLATASVTKKKKRVMRHKTAGLISLEEIGLSEEKDNFIRAGDVEKTGSWISPIDFNDEELMNCIDLRAFRTYFRENIKRRVEEDSYIPSVTIEQLHEEIRDVENELDGLKLQQEMLKTIIDSYSLPTNPVERVLLSFRHPQKLHGQPINMDESIISNYKLALQQDEIQIPNEFTDNLPLEQFYLIQRFCKDEPILQLLKKITPQPPLPINIDTSQSAYFVKRPVLDLHYNLEPGAFEEPTGPMGRHLTEAYSPVEEIAKTTELFDL